MIYLDFGADGSDPFDFLVQGGTNGGLVINDLSPIAASVTINNYASFSNAQTRFGNNTILCTTIGAAIPAFSSTGAASRFGRAIGDKFTIECWVYVAAYANFSTAGFFFSWWSLGNRIFEIGLAGGFTPKLRTRNGEDAAVASATFTTGSWQFIQMNIDGTSYTIDVNGVEVYTGTNSFQIGNTGAYDFYVAAQTSFGNNGGSSTEIYVTPLRLTKGTLRARGSVPTAAFPTF